MLRYRRNAKGRTQKGTTKWHDDNTKPYDGGKPPALAALPASRAPRSETCSTYACLGTSDVFDHRHASSCDAASRRAERVAAGSANGIGAKRIGQPGNCAGWVGFAFAESLTIGSGGILSG